MIHSFIHSSYTKHLHTAKQVCQQDAYPQYAGVQLKLCATLRPATFPFADWMPLTTQKVYSQLVPKVNSYQVNSYPSQLVPMVNSYQSQLVPKVN